MIATDDETRLIRALYGDTPEAGIFTGFRALLADRTGASGAALTLTRQNRSVVAAEPNDPMPRALLASDSLRRERVYTPGEVPGLPEMPFRALRLLSDDGTDVWLSIWRPKRDFRATDSTLLSHLGPHVERAVDLWTTLRDQRARSDFAARLLTAQGMAPLWFDTSGRVARISAQAQAYLGTLPGWTLAGDGRLIAPEAVARAMRSPPKAGTLVLARNPLTCLTFDPTPDDDGLLRAVVSRAPDPGAIEPVAVAQALGLEPNEARLAIALARGASLAEAASAHGWTEGTARSYAKRAYARLGLRSQTDLARLVLSGLWSLP